MKASISHVAIYTKDLERMKAFYEKYFDAKSNEKYSNDSGFSSYFISFDSEVRIELMTHTKLEYREVLDKVNGFSHIAISVGSKENVIDLTNRIQRDGYRVLRPARVTGDGYFESCVSDPEGNTIEITI